MIIKESLEASEHILISEKDEVRFIRLLSRAIADELCWYRGFNQSEDNEGEIEEGERKPLAYLIPYIEVILEIVKYSEIWEITLWESALELNYDVRDPTIKAIIIAGEIVYEPSLHDLN